MRFQRRASVRCCLAAAPGLLFGTALWAQEPVGGETVLTRIRPELDPIGVRLGTFLAYPNVSQQILHDDNVFAINAERQSAYLFETSPRLAIRSDWAQHALNFQAFAGIGRNPDFPSEDYFDWQIATDGRVDVVQNIRVSGGGSVGRSHVQRSAPDETRGIKPTQADQAELFGRYEHQFSRVALALNTRVTRWDYDDVIALRNDRAVVINHDDRDRTELRVELRGRYRFVPRFMPFARIRGYRRDYDDLQDATLADRSSVGYEMSGGLELDLGGITSGEFSVGYRVQDYDEPFPDISAPVFGADLSWHATALTTASVTVDRMIQETPSGIYSGYVSTITSFTIDHELLRNVLLNAGITYTEDDYESIGATERNDTTYELRLGSTYMLNRYLHVLLQYYYFRRESSVSIESFSGSAEVDKNLIAIQLQLQL